MRMLKIKEITKYHCYQMRLWRYKVMSINNYKETELRVSDSEIEKHECQSSA